VWGGRHCRGCRNFGRGLTNFDFVFKWPHKEQERGANFEAFGQGAKMLWGAAKY